MSRIRLRHASGTTVVFAGAAVPKAAALCAYAAHGWKVSG